MRWTRRKSTAWASSWVTRRPGRSSWKLSGSKWNGRGSDGWLNHPDPPRQSTMMCNFALKFLSFVRGQTFMASMDGITGRAFLTSGNR